ncbi:LOB domain-containing protein 29-like [Diospyros lotus]|uniref:LOB domain-containing protein 29-like n=1 Tax=Diospyros lotus TaxID=55363 RepID=UPI00225233BA|nr:LOB domain-containing protein 29-like [Diospyros lotus]
MPRIWSRCGACIVLNRGCNPQCIFASYFSHAQGDIYFVVIHYVFGARNVSNLLAQLSLGDRFRAADTFFFGAKVWLQDFVYGCVSDILALQQQDFNRSKKLGKREVVLRVGNGTTIVALGIGTTSLGEQSYIVFRMLGATIVQNHDS